MNLAGRAQTTVQHCGHGTDTRRRGPWAARAVPAETAGPSANERRDEDEYTPGTREPYLERGMRLLEVFAQGCSPLKLSEISERAGLPMTTTHRLVQALRAAGALESDEDKRYRIGRRLITLATQVIIDGEHTVDEDDRAY